MSSAGLLHGFAVVALLAIAFVSSAALGAVLTFSVLSERKKDIVRRLIAEKLVRTNSVLDAAEIATQHRCPACGVVAIHRRGSTASWWICAACESVFSPMVAATPDGSNRRLADSSNAGAQNHH